jgi:methylmalonyl-CoA mutase N-terminal domain/subunit
VAAVRQRRDAAAVDAGLAALKRAAGGTANLMPPLLDCVRAYATEGEIMSALKEVFGVYREPNVF